jgi:phosphatidylinositol alpha-mannosyltransferase/D-inositol-3-phosphate glycosyltransferase
VRIALFCNDYWPTIGGVQTAVRGLARALRERGHEPVVLTCRPRGCAAAEEVDGIPVRRFEWSLNPRGSFLWRAWRARREVRQAVFDWRPEALYVHFVTVSGLYAYDCARGSRLPLLLSFRGNDVMGIAPRSVLTRRLYSALTAAADVNLFCSRWLERAGSALPWFRGRPGRTGVLADAVVVEPRTAPALPAGAAYVFAAGRMVRKKGFDLLLQAWAGLGTRVGMPLWIAGDGEERPALEQLAKQFGLGERVRFLGAVPHPEMLGLLERATLCVAPSRDEPYGILVVEAQALGVPVVATAVGNLPELIDHGRTGYLAEPTVDGLMQAIGAALEDPRRCEIGRAGHEAPGAQRGYQSMAAELEGWVQIARSGPGSR